MTERKALIVAIIGAAFMSVLGIGFALLTESEAILLDGVFSGIGFMMAMVTLKVSQLVAGPDDEHFQFGYAHFAPLINVMKALLMIVLCSFALVSAVNALLSGGRPLNVGPAVIYGAIATAGGIALAWFLWRAARQTGSPLVELDARGALIDMVMSAGVLASFIGGWFMVESAYADYLDYVDPTLVTVMCVLSLPIPLKLLFMNLREVLLAAPDESLQNEIRDRLFEAFDGMNFADYRIRMVKLGNVMNVLIHVMPEAGASPPPLEAVDARMQKFRKALDDMGLRGACDVVFVSDMSMAN